MQRCVRVRWYLRQKLDEDKLPQSEKDGEYDFYNSSVIQGNISQHE